MTSLRGLTSSILIIIVCSNPLWAGDLQTSLFQVEQGSQDTGLHLLTQKMTGLAASDQVPGGMMTSSRSKPISRGGAMLRSLLVPGWGESYLGHHRTARYFFWTEVAIWAGVIGLETYSNWKENQFIAYAATHSGAKMGGKTEGFYADIGNYDNTDAYNEAKLRERNYEALYTSSTYYWDWDTKENRLDYDDMRIASKSAHNKVYFLFGAAAINRLISFIDTGKKARDAIRAQNKPDFGFSMQPGQFNGNNSVNFVVTANF